jgi:hypothetical protein
VLGRAEFHQSTVNSVPRPHLPHHNLRCRLISPNPHFPAQSLLRIRSADARQGSSMGEAALSHGVAAIGGDASPEGRWRRHAVRGISSDEGMALLAGIHLGSCRLTLPMMCDGREAVDAIRWSGGVRGRAGRPQGPTMALQGTDFRRARLACCSMET